MGFFVYLYNMEKLVSKKENHFKYFIGTVLGFVLVGLSFDLILIVLTLTQNEKMLETVTKFVGKFI